jgi:dihydroorotate dehydrogenase electron transfer subunit
MTIKAVSDFTVVDNIVFGNNQHKLVLQSDAVILPVSPGQFANVEIQGNNDVFLRRPFSIFDFDRLNRTITILVKVLGRGSRTLTRVEPGMKLSLVYPLGNGFSLPQKDEKILLVGGGSGVAPLLFLASKSGLKASQMDVLLGARTAADHVPVEAYSSLAVCHFTTEDGSLGEAGLVTSHSLFSDLSGYDKIYCCGPLPMMKAVASIARAQQIFCEVSLENLMACGFGVCLCCIEPTIKGNLTVCTEGPVFNINDLVW